MQLFLDADDAALLATILAGRVDDLRGEIAGTESYRLRQELKQDEVRVKALIERLNEAVKLEAGASTS